MVRRSIQRRLIATVILSQALLALGLLLAGIYYTNRRLLSTLDMGLQSRATSVAALVRYTEDDSGRVYFDERMVPQSLDPAHPDLFAVWTDKSGFLARSKAWPAGLDIASSGSRYWSFSYGGVPYRALRLPQISHDIVQIIAGVTAPRRGASL